MNQRLLPVALVEATTTPKPATEPGRGSVATEVTTPPRLRFDGVGKRAGGMKKGIDRGLLELFEVETEPPEPPPPDAAARGIW